VIKKIEHTYSKNFEAIFGGKPPEGGAFTQVEGKLVPRETIAAATSVNAPMVMKPHQDFVSPITREVISSRAQLAKHNKTHGVTNAADYSGDYIGNRARERNAAGEKYLKETRITDIHEAIQKHS
jgi:hypothetical protein